MATRRYTLLLAAGLLALTSSLAPASTFGQGAPSFEADLALAPAAEAEAATVWRLDNFDPVEDVPSMDNWMGDVDSEGSGNCFAMSVLTSYFFQKVDFVDEPGTEYDAWKQEGGKVGSRSPLDLDEEGLRFLALWLAVGPDHLEEHGKLKVGGFSSLRDMTRPGSLAEERFRQIAEAIQFSMQLRTDLHRYGGSILKSRLGFLPGMGRDDVHKDGFHIVRDRMQDGRPSLVTLHPDSPNPAGHVLVVYQVRETEDAVEMTCYDSNAAPEGGEAVPATIRLDKDDGWKMTVTRESRTRYSSFELLSCPNPDGGRERRKYASIAGNYQEHLERNRHLGDMVGRDRSVPERILGGVKLVGEVLNPF